MSRCEGCEQEVSEEIRLEFYGASDDLLEMQGDLGEEEWGGFNRTIMVELSCGEGPICRIVARYGEDQNGATWLIAPVMIDEDRCPIGDYWYTFEGYSPHLHIRVSRDDVRFAELREEEK